MKPFLLLLSITTMCFGGVIKAPCSCDNSAVVFELNRIVKWEIGDDLATIAISRHSETDSGTQLCRAVFHTKMDLRGDYLFSVVPLNNAIGTLPKHDAVKYKEMSYFTRKEYVRVEFFKNMNKDNRSINQKIIDSQMKPMNDEFKKGTK